MLLQHFRKPGGIALLAGLAACGGGHHDRPPTASDAQLVEQGKQIFRFDTFGDETFWTDTLRCTKSSRPRSIRRRRLSVGLKVDAEALPPAVVHGIQDGSISLTDPATTIALLKLDAVVGVKGTVETVNGIGQADARRHHLRAVPFDGRRFVRTGHRQAPRRLAEPRPQSGRDHRAVAGARPRQQKAVYNSWGPGKYDPRFNIDGMNGPVVIPPAYGLQGIHKHHVHRRRRRVALLEPLRRR